MPIRIDNLLLLFTLFLWYFWPPYTKPNCINYTAVIFNFHSLFDMALVRPIRTVEQYVQPSEKAPLLFGFLKVSSIAYGQALSTGYRTSYSRCRCGSLSYENHVLNLLATHNSISGQLSEPSPFFFPFPFFFFFDSFASLARLFASARAFASSA